MSCEVCAELYEQTVRTPLVLPCGHTFCRPCLTNIKQTGHFHCPTCRAGHNNLQVEALTVNYMALSILPLCDQFESDTCTTHGDDLRYWCADCDLSLCSICLHSGHPQTHTVKLAQTFVKEQKQKLQEKLNAVFKSIEQHKKALKQGLNDVNAQVVQLFRQNAHLHNTEVAVEDLLGDIRKANDIASVLSYEKVVEDLQLKTDFADPDEEKAQEKGQLSEDALVKKSLPAAEDKDALLVTTEDPKEAAGDAIEAATVEETAVPTWNAIDESELLCGLGNFFNPPRMMYYTGRHSRRHGVRPLGPQLVASSGRHALHHLGPRLVTRSGRQGFQSFFNEVASSRCHGFQHFGRQIASTNQPQQGPTDAPRTVRRLIASTNQPQQEPADVPRAVMDYRDGRLLLHTLALPASTRLSLQVPREVFLELGVGDRCLGRVYIRLWCHLRRAQQLLALCMGTMGPSLLGAKASDKVGNIIVFRSAVDGNKQTVSHALLTGLEWGGQHAKPQAEGLVTGMDSNSMAFGIGMQGHSGTAVKAAFGEVVAGLEVAKEAFQHNPVSEVTITSCGLVLPGLSQLTLPAAERTTDEKAGRDRWETLNLR